MEGVARAALNENSMLALALGYQQTDWDDDDLGMEEALTGSLDLGIRASDVLWLNAFADHNLSETLYGLEAQWDFGKVTMDVGYTYVDDYDDPVDANDQQVSLTLTIPLGGQSYATRRNALPFGTTGSGQRPSGNTSLSGIMGRPNYLPTSSITARKATSAPPEVLTTYYRDADDDGYGNPDSASDAVVQPDGFVADNGDCDDTDASVNPGATEVADSVDNNCNGQIDEGVLTTYYLDADDDGYGDPINVTQAAATPPGYVENNSDCDDTRANVNPAAPDIADSTDNDCNGLVDDDPTYWTTFFRDLDGDNFGDASNSFAAAVQPNGFISDNNDCNDTDADVNPDATEVADGVDNDCDGQIDEVV